LSRRCVSRFAVCGSDSSRSFVDEEAGMPIKVLVADDHEVVRQGLASLLSGTEIKIVAEADNAEKAVQLVKKHRPDVVLLDIRFRNGDGLTALKRIRDEQPSARVVMLSNYDNPTYIARSAALGASDYVLKGSGKQELISAITSAVQGMSPIRNSPMKRIMATMAKREQTGDSEWPMTQREMQVLRHMAHGLTNKEIARSLEISVETVKEHVQNVLRKIGVTDRTQAAVWAVRHELV
jgi:DNA-binding NarL/FixJ family response regulator